MLVAAASFFTVQIHPNENHNTDPSKSAYIQLSLSPSSLSLSHLLTLIAIRAERERCEVLNTLPIQGLKEKDLMELGYVEGEGEVHTHIFNWKQSHSVSSERSAVYPI